MTRFASISVSLLLLAGCQPAAPRPPDPREENSHQIHQLEKHRGAFEAYATGDRSEVVWAELDAAGVFGRPDPEKNGRVQFDWRLWSAMDEHHPMLIYCPHGAADLPADFWAKGNKYRHPHQIDDHWFAALRSWMRDPPPR